MRTCILLAAALTVICISTAHGDFNPARSFPSSWDKIQVFADQLPVASMSPAQKQFAATHFAGTQKLMSNRIGELRVYNPEFLMLQYRLGVRTSSANFIHNNTWSNDFAVIDPHEDWYVHDDQGNRVFQTVGAFEEYVMDISGLINGNTVNDYKAYVGQTMIADAIASDADGVFADSTHLPYGVSSEFYDSPIGSPPHTAYIDDMEVYYDSVYQQFNQANQYFIPNIGSLVTTSDTTTGYYEDVHGAMVEGFGTQLSNYDWKLQANRTLKLIQNDKIWIGQNTVGSPSDVAGRLWYLGNFLLLRDDNSFVNILDGAAGGGGVQLSSWPEYDLELGAPLDQTAPGSVATLLDSSGIYARPYEQGLVLVNPTTSSRTYFFSSGEEYELVTPFGGGSLNSSANWILPTGIQTTSVAGSITLSPWSSAILLSSTLDGDFDGDGDVDGADFLKWQRDLGDAPNLALWQDNYGNSSSIASAVGVPEPSSLLLFVAAVSIWLGTLHDARGIR